MHDEGADSPELAAAIPTLREPPQPIVPRRPRLWLHLSLFVLTFASAVVSQLRQEGGAGYGLDPALILAAPQPFLRALVFAVALMAILLAHEMGHWLTARRFGVDQSLPYFIPAPTFVGTLGALILMRSQPPNRRVLLDVAVMGPFAGFIVALPAVVIGLWLSSGDTATLASSDTVIFGPSLLFAGLERLVLAEPVATLHPLARAGWVGLFVTSINLIPAGQLDGGHVTYALFGRHHRRISRWVIALLSAVGLVLTFGPTQPAWGGSVWLFWAILLLAMGTSHPRVADEGLPLRRRHKVLGLAALALFVLTFVPVPVSNVPGPLTPDEVIVDPPRRPRPRPRRDEQPSELPAPEHPAEEFRL